MHVKISCPLGFYNAFVDCENKAVKHIDENKLFIFPY